MNARRSVLTACLLAAAVPAWSQAVYRCGSSYSEHPCAGGRAVATTDARSTMQQAESQRAAVRDGRLADGMERDRRRTEAKAEREAGRERKGRAEGERERREARAAEDDEAWPKEPFVARVPAQPRKPKDAPRKRE